MNFLQLVAELIVALQTKFFLALYRRLEDYLSQSESIKLLQSYLTTYL
jgi:hypothetical protein